MHWSTLIRTVKLSWNWNLTGYPGYSFFPTPSTPPSQPSSSERPTYMEYQADSSTGQRKPSDLYSDKNYVTGGAEPPFVPNLRYLPLSKSVHPSCVALLLTNNWSSWSLCKLVERAKQKPPFSQLALLSNRNQINIQQRLKLCCDHCSVTSMFCWHDFFIYVYWQLCTKLYRR